MRKPLVGHLNQGFTEIFLRPIRLGLYKFNAAYFYRLPIGYETGSSGSVV